jgi:hypothetical protein
MRYTQARRHRRITLSTVYFVPELTLPDGPQPIVKLLNPKRFRDPAGSFRDAIGVLSLL